jgi:predicted XRE-type DNA-binding protein
MDTDREIENLRSIGDPVARWRAVADLQQHIAMAVRDISWVRTEIVIQMRQSGLSLQQIANLLGVSKTRVADIESQRWSDVPRFGQ